jgi:hypothetical protein
MGSVVDELEEEGVGDRVGEVGDEHDFSPAAFGKQGKVGGENVFVDEGDVFREILPLVVHAHDAAVDLVAIHLTRHCRQGLGEGAEADSDLDDDIVHTNARGMDDGLGSVTVNEEILAKGLFRRQPVPLEEAPGGVVGIGHEWTPSGSAKGGA